jgi:hypothetical protein
VFIGCGMVAVMIWAVCRWPVLVPVADSLMLEEAEPPIGLPPGCPVAGSWLWLLGLGGLDLLRLLMNCGIAASCVFLLRLI